MNLTLQHTCALITGSRRGLGAAIVKRLARETINAACNNCEAPRTFSNAV